MLTVLANMRINNPVRLQHLKDSFNSFSSVSDNWLVNVRGKFREDALIFLRKKLGEKMVEFKLLNDSRGWARNSKDMLKEAKYNYVLVFNEDHLNIAPCENYAGIIREMEAENVDILPYSFWCNGTIRKGFDDLPLKKMQYIDAVQLTQELWKHILKANDSKYYLVSMVSIFKKDFLDGLFDAECKKLPGYFTAIVNKTIYTLNKISNLFRKNKILLVDGKYFDFVNKYFFRYRLINFPKDTPFDLERNGKRSDLLPVKFALPKQELFANIDFDCGFSNYSLIQRGLYQEPTGNHGKLKNNSDEILDEIRKVFSDISEEDVELLVREIINAQKIFLTGAGRVGLAVRGFAMRLGHLGLNSFIIGDTNVPAIKEHDLLLVASGSGETQTVYDLVVIAKNNGARIALITGNKDSRMAKIADSIVIIKAPSKVKPVEGFRSIQPMTTLNEQCLGIFFDSLVLKIMEEINETHETMWARHSNLE